MCYDEFSWYLGRTKDFLNFSPCKFLILYSCCCSYSWWSSWYPALWTAVSRRNTSCCTTRTSTDSLLPLLSLIHLLPHPPSSLIHLPHSSSWMNPQLPPCQAYLHRHGWVASYLMCRLVPTIHPRNHHQVVNPGNKVFKVAYFMRLSWAFNLSV